LKILAFPCNQFGAQEPKPNAEIKKFAMDKYGANFQIFSKIDVNGENADDVYAWCRRNSDMYDQETDTALRIPWNFSKFLVDRNGNLLKHYDQKPFPLEFRQDIIEILEDKGNNI